MKNFNFAKVMALVLMCAGMSFAQSCTNDCDSVSCLNGGTCTDGVCDCPTGFGGDLCENAIACSVVTCGTNASCEVDATSGIAECYCNDGYETDAAGDCTVQIRNRYTNGGTVNYTANQDVCTSGSYNYSAKMYNDSDVTKFVIEGLGGFDAPVITPKATVKDITKFELSEQTQANWGLTVKGTALGSVDTTTNNVALSYNVKFADNTTDDCTVLLDRQ